MLFDEALRAKRDEVVRVFVDDVRRAFRKERGENEANIVDHVPRMLDELADALETGRTSLPPAKEVAQQHAQTRWQQGIDVRTLVREYALLRTSLLSVCGHPSAKELTTVDSFFNASIADAVSEYAQIAETDGARLRDDLERENERLRGLQLSLSVLSEAGSMLAESSADQRQVVDGLASLCVPRLADCCSVYLLEESAPSYLAVVHSVPEKAGLLRALYERFPLSADSPHGFPSTLRTGKPDLVTNARDDLYVAIAQSTEHLAALRALAPSSWMVVPMTVQGGVPFAMLALFQTESGRTFTAEDLERAEELARRTALVLDNSRLFDLARRERARAEEATRAKDEFLAVVSHELRTPLNAILGWSRMLRSGAQSPGKLERGLDVIERNASAQAQLINDLLDVSRIVTGHLRLEVGSIDIVNVVEMALEALAPAADAKSIALDVLLDTNTGIVRGDPTRLHQIVWNIVANAVKFTPKHGKVKVSLRRVSSDIELVVEDSGAGIDKAALPFIFERFRQEDASVVRTFGGLGLGLAIARHLVELHGGSIAAASAGKNAGSTFTVRIPVSPLKTTAISRAVLPPREHAARSLDAAKVAGMRVLIAEDEPDARELLEELLGSCGLDVRATASVADALAEFHRERPDVVISDIGMPDEDGYSFVRKIRALPDSAGGNTPMIALTAFARTEDRTRAIVEGFNAHLAKPIEPSELLDVLGSLRFRP